LYQLESRADVTTLSTPDAAGSAYLTFTRSGTDTVLTRAFAKSPAKLIASKGRGATCWVYAATFGGGLVGGDHIQLRADVTAGARALLTTQASTKVYRSENRSRQSLTATVGANALLAVVPDPIVCFAAADFAQQQRYDLHADKVSQLRTGIGYIDDCFIIFIRHHTSLRPQRLPCGTHSCGQDIFLFGFYSSIAPHSRLINQ
jgi:hypothetical protein